MSTPRHTLRHVARELGLPESTVRYYRDLFEGWLPSDGRGRRRRYPADAIPLFRLIAEGYAQNRNRAEIEAALTEAANGRLPVVHAQPMPLTAAAPDPLTAAVLEGERERREAMWQMAREIVRLGEAVERQHVVLHELVRRLDAASRLALPAASPAAADAGETASSLDDQLVALRRELATERDLVERLRKSKLDLERRATEAEAALETGPAGRGGLLRRVLRRDDRTP